MALAFSSLSFLLAGCMLSAQVAPAPAPPGAAPPNGSVTAILPDLDRLQAAASQANLDLGHMRIEKWRTDGHSKQQAQANADSIQRNLTSALPELITKVRAAPQDLTAEFKLYRNLNALYDVFATLTESAGAFGSRNDYDALAQQLNVIDSVRRDLGNSLEALASSTQSELDQLRAQVRARQQAAAAAPPKKVIVDDTEPPKRAASHKKKATSKAAASGSASSSGNATQAATPKSQ